ncbi:hypothetical protein WBG78_11845 [Chryseolinea sp. T2]|uniref:MutS-related protein n=1 Tax=Chryseolinea sp. T2 TaxID=3129255 RepID=UPI003077E3C2
MFGSRRKNALEKLRAEWGRIKDAPLNVYQVARYHARKEFDPGVHVLSDKTISALDFSELFCFLDRTVSRVGQQWLFSRLASYGPNEDVAEFESTIAFAAANEQKKLTAQMALTRLQHENAYGLCALFFNPNPRPPGVLPLLKLQSVLSVVIFIGTLFQSALFVPLIIMLGINTLLHYYYKAFIQQYNLAMDQLVLLTAATSELQPLSFPYKRNDKVAAALKSVREVAKSWTILGGTPGSGSDATELSWVIREYVKILFFIEPILFFSVIKKLANRKEDVRILFEYVGFIDGCISVLSVRQSTSSCIPTRVTAAKGAIDAEGMFHPLIAKCRRNSWSLEDRSLLITGSNMSGKSAFIRTVAINVLCAHTINTAFASSFLSSYHKLFAVMNIADDLIEVKSYYMEEVLSIQELVKRSENEGECLFLLDEIYRGTNTTERIAAAYAVLKYLNKKNIAVAATHDSELTSLLEEGYDMYHFSETLDRDGLSFDYILKKGKLKHGNAIRILEYNGYPAEIIHTALMQSEKSNR